MRKTIIYLMASFVMVWSLNFTTDVFAMEFIPIESPDICKAKSEYRRRPCGRWSYLQEIPEPDAWKYTRRNRETHRWRWYGEAKAVATKVETIELKNIYFDFDKSDLRPDVIHTLDQTIKKVRSENTRIKIIGHADAIGADDYNQALSERRAKAARDYLVEQGIETQRITTMGRGESEPIAPNTLPNGEDNPNGRAKNRRAEFKADK